MELNDLLSKAAEVIDIAARVKETISNAQSAIPDSTNQTEESANSEVDLNIQQILDSAISSNSDSNLAKIIAAATKIAKSTGALDLAKDSVYDIASMGDEVAARITTAYQVANGEIDVEEAAENLIDRSAARLIVLTENYIDNKLPIAVDAMCKAIVSYCPQAAPLEPIIKNAVNILQHHIKDLVRKGITAIAGKAKNAAPKIINWAKSKAVAFAGKAFNFA